MLTPDFVIAGGHKCATTSLHALMARNPGIQMSEPKEPHYFARKSLESRLHMGVWKPEDYEALWPKADRDIKRGEASVLYLYFAEEVASRMLTECNSPPQIVVCVRNPIDRAFSSYCDVRLKNPDETAGSFDLAVERELGGDPRSLGREKSPTMHHLALGFYSTGIEVFRRMLGSAKVHLILFDDLEVRPDLAMRGLEELLGVDRHDLIEPTSVENRGGVRWSSRPVQLFSRSPAVVAVRRGIARRAPRTHARLKSAAMNRWTTAQDEMSKSTRWALADLYGEEVQELEDLFHRDLSHWLIGG